MFDLFGILFPIVFFMVLGTFIMTMAKGLSTWNKNNHSPRLTVEAAVTAKRIHGPSPPCQCGRRFGSPRLYGHVLHEVFCHLPGGKRRPDGAFRFRAGIRDVS